MPSTMPPAPTRTGALPSPSILMPDGDGGASPVNVELQYPLVPPTPTAPAVARPPVRRRATFVPRREARATRNGHDPAVVPATIVPAAVMSPAVMPAAAPVAAVAPAPAIHAEPAASADGPSAGADCADPAAPAAEAGSFVHTGLEWVAILAGALVVALVIKVTLFQAFLIPSESMLPTLRNSERVLVNKLSYRIGDIERGDVVVFERRDTAQGGLDDSDLIKRVVGLPGDRIAAVDGRVLIDDVVLVEEWLSPGTLTENLPAQVVPAGEIFVMGDNRRNSRDSRVFGTVPVDLIVGQAFLRWWPFSRAGTL